MSKALTAVEKKECKIEHQNMPATRIFFLSLYTSFMLNLLGSNAETCGNLFVLKTEYLPVNAKKQPTKNSGLNNMS